MENRKITPQDMNKLATAAHRLGVDPMAYFHGFGMVEMTVDEFIENTTRLKERFLNIERWAETAKREEILQQMMAIPTSLLVLPWTGQPTLDVLDALDVLSREIRKRATMQATEERIAPLN